MFFIYMNKINEFFSRFSERDRKEFKDQLIEWGIIVGAGLAGIGLMYLGSNEHLSKLITIPSLIIGMGIAVVDGSYVLCTKVD